MPEKKKKPHPAEQFNDPEMEQVKRFGQALGGAPTDFDEQVETALNERQRAQVSPCRRRRRISPPQSNIDLLQL
jgi:hypothetical protein